MTRSRPFPSNPGSVSVFLGLALGLLSGAAPQSLFAQSDYFFPEGQSFDPGIPSPEDFLGYPIGSFVTRQDRIVAYMQELARLSDRATYQSIGMTYEHRSMPVLTVTSPSNHARLEDIRRQHLATLEPGVSEYPSFMKYLVHIRHERAGIP